MKNGLTEIVFLIYRSGSMAVVAEETVSGFDAFIEDQKKLPGDVSVTAVQFDNECEQLFAGKDLKDVPSLKDLYKPRGWTALYQSLGRLINETGHRLALLAEDKRPEKVMFVVITDGADNQPSEFTVPKIKSMIEHQKAKYNWDFVFLGANQDAVLTGSSLGIGAGKSLTYANNAIGTQSAFASVSNYSGKIRGASVLDVQTQAFDDSDRDAQKEAGVN